MSQSIIEKFLVFLEKYWSLSKLKADLVPTDEELIGIKRGVWYCNISSQKIPQLQKFNYQKDPSFIIKDPSNQNDDDNTDDDQQIIQLSMSLIRSHIHAFNKTIESFDSATKEEFSEAMLIQLKSV